MVDGQITWGGLTLGRPSVYRWRQLDGWEDLPGLDSSDEARPSRHGAWAGRPLAESRTVTLEGSIRAPAAEVGAAVRALRSATAVADDADLQPLTIAALGETLTAYARCTQRTISLTRDARLGHIRYTLQWVCPDPTRYGAERSLTIPAPSQTVDGLDYPVSYPLDYGAPITGGAGTAINNGSTSARPVITITGPASTPLIANQITGLTLEFALDLVEGDSLTIDTDAGTVRLNGSADRLYTLTARSAPVEAFTLPPGASSIRYRPESTSTPSAAALTWRDAHL
ncbi:hypothetical protein GCM10009799_20650 [Nocardiopsis rhodophaea]|uniref:Siphovirus-type tail component C-terminal domain-containing protein n=1 Tax=Nocardiopsis rhodophaea TaxID=280238 RepID=A0ABP5EAW2_9ACTN